MTGRLLFGIYPGGASGDERGGLAEGPPDDPGRITALLDQLQPPGHPFLVRAYVAFTDDVEPGGPAPITTPLGAAGYALRGRALDLVAQYQSRSGDVDGYCAFVADLVTRYGAVTSTLQITEEPNMTTLATLDGYYPAVADAVTAGVRAAKSRARLLGHDHLRVGFNTTPLFGPGTAFVTDLVARGGRPFVDELDYVGLDFFPDVFAPIAAADLPDAVEGLLHHHRYAVLAPAGLADLALHITENGWPTGEHRTPARQAQVLDTVIRTVAANAAGLHLSGYTHFALRDADTGRPGLFHRFGLTTDDYETKPAFTTYRRLIAEHTV